MRSDRSRALVGLAAIASLGACADLIGASFGPYEVEPTSTSSASTSTSASSSGGGTSVSGSSSGAGGDGGAGADGGGGSSPSSTSSGVGCEEWPAGSGEWKWATQISLDLGSELHLAAIIPSTSTIRPWAAVGHYVGSLFSEGLGAGTTDNPAPFAVAIGPNDFDVDGAMALACDGECLGLRVDDGASDRSVWREGDAATWLVGAYQGSFGGFAANERGGTPYVLRVSQNEDDAHAFSALTFLPSRAYPVELPEGLSDEGGTLFGVEAHGGLVGMVGTGKHNSLFDVTSMSGFEHYFVGVAYPFATLSSRLGGRLTSGTVHSDCGSDLQHARPLDVALAGSADKPPVAVWTAGGACGTGPAGGGSATPPGNGFVVRQNSEPVPDTSILSYEDPGEAALQFGAPAVAIAAIDPATAVIVGEAGNDDVSPGLPDGSEPFPDERMVYVSMIDLESDTLVPRWVTRIDAPGAQHAVDVAVRRVSSDEVEVYVAGTTVAPFTQGAFTSPCAFEGEQVGFVAKLDGEGTLVWLRTFGRDRVRPVQLKVGAQGLVVAVETGVGGFTLEPIAAGVEDELLILPTSRSFFVGELSF